MRRPNGSDDHQTSATAAEWAQSPYVPEQMALSEAVLVAVAIHTAGPEGMGLREIATSFNVSVKRVKWRGASDNERDRWRRERDWDRARADGWCMGLFAERF